MRLKHYYAFSCREGSDTPAYERTFGSASKALRWVSLDPENRFYTINCTPVRYFY
tara:strand:- start:384 stop:548 length:165 start_codon:yes stop_codon:yes gene_type:complete